MDQDKDIRDRSSLSGEEVLSLNFINDSGPYLFRKYYRSGLRSHIFEVVRNHDLKTEHTGIIKDGIRIFPRAVPIKIFRIFRDRFKTSKEIFHEIHKYKTLLKFLGPALIAQSEEFMVEYKSAGKKQILLCGLQEYVEGEILDPWKIFGNNYLETFYQSLTDRSDSNNTLTTAKKNIGDFVHKIRHMFNETGYIPDLAGIGNLILTDQGELKLVDINNISKLKFSKTIPIDDKGYPSCDISVEVLYILETRILNSSNLSEDSFYKYFLNEKRRKKVKELEKNFYHNLK